MMTREDSTTTLGNETFSQSRALPHPRTLGWVGTTALALGGSNQSVFLIGALIAGQGHIPGQGTAAIPLLILGLLLAWLAAPGWTELVLMWPDRVGGIASCCAEAFRPYSAVLANLTGTCYWWGWVPTCGLTALLSASAIHQWYLPHAPVPLLACGLVVSFALLNLCGVRQVTRFAIPTAALSAALAFLSALIPVLTGHVNWHQATDFHLTLPFPGIFGGLTAAMAGLYLVGFAAPAFEAATCHVGETIDPAKNVPRAVFAGGAVATLYFCLLPVIWLGVLGPAALSGDLARSLGPTFAPWLGSAAKAAAIWFMILNMFHGTIQPLAGAARTLAQLAEDGLLPRVFARRSRRDVPWVTTWLTAGMAIVFLLAGDPIWLVAAANLAYLIGIGLPNLAVWLLRRDQPDRARPYRAPRWTISAGVVSAAVWGLATLLGFQQFGLPTVLFGLALALSGAVLYGVRRWSDREHCDILRPARSLHVNLTGAMLLVLALDGAGYLLAIAHVGQGQTALIAGLEDIFVAVALLTLAVGLILPGMVAHTAEQVTQAAGRLADVTLADLSRAMQALGEGSLEAAQARVDVFPVVVHSQDEMGLMATIFNRMQAEAVRAAGGLDRAREGLRRTRQDLLDANTHLELRVAERTDALQAANQSLRESEERFRSLVQNATDMITVLDGGGVIRYQSPAEQRLLGHCPEALIGTSLFMLMHPDDLPQVQPLLVQVFQTPGISPPVEFRLRHQDGSWRLLEAICSNLLNDPNVRGIVVNSRDVTERRALEDERERLLTESEARAEREALINRIGVILRNFPDPDHFQPAAMQELGEALGADRCFFSFYDLPKDEVLITYDWRRPALTPLTGRHCLSEIQEVAQQLCGPEGTHVISDGRACGWSEPAVAALESMELRSAICVPLIGHGQMAAVLCVAMAHDPRDWTSDEVRLVETIASHTWTALETARSRQREHAIADSLQRALLPPVPRDVPELDFDTHYKAALAESNIGGDFYDVFPLENGSYAFAVGDVSGKGLAAAAQVATVRHMLRTVLYLGLTVAEAVTQLNMLVIDHGLLRGFVTLFVGVCNTQTGILTYVNCGHEPGMLRRAGTQQVEELMPSGLPLSIQREERYTQNLVALSPGDALILFTDGLSEAPSAERDLLGISGVSQLLQESEGQESASSLISSLVAGVAAYAGADLRDDLCILAVVVRSAVSSLAGVNGSSGPEAAPCYRLEETRLPILSDTALPALLTPAGVCEGEDRYRQLMELSPDLTAIVQNGKFVSLNSAGCRLLGADRLEEILGRPLLDMVHPHWRPVVQARLRQLVPERLMEGIEQQWVRLDGGGVLVEMSAAATTYAGEPALQIIACDITHRREIQEQNVRLLCEVNVAAVRQRIFLRDVLASVTAGRLHLCEEPGDLPPCLNRYGERLSLTRENLGRLRHRTREAAQSLQLSSERCQDLESAVGEAAMNAVAHAGGGTGQVCTDSAGTVQVWIQDEGAGISLEHLPQATLERGYTTANTLGHGFWIMLQTVDRIWLLTSPEGTTLVLEQGKAKSEPAWHGLADDDLAGSEAMRAEALPRSLLVGAAR